MNHNPTRTVIGDRVDELDVEDLDHLRRRLVDLEDAHADWKMRSGLGLMFVSTLAVVAWAKAVERPGFHSDHSWLQDQIDDITRRLHLHIHPEEITHR